MNIKKATVRVGIVGAVIGASGLVGGGFAHAEEPPPPLISVSGVTLPPVPSVEVNVGSLDGLVPGLPLPGLGGGGLPLPGLGEGLPALPELGEVLPLPALGDGLPALDGLIPGVTLPELGEGLPALDGLIPGVTLPQLGEGLPLPGLGEGLPALDGIVEGLPVLGEGGLTDALPLPGLGQGLPELPVPAAVTEALAPILNPVKAILSAIGLGFLVDQLPL